MLIVETSAFTRRVLKLMADEDYRLLQRVLVADPVRGDLIRGSGGLRKIRWSGSGRGKRGGARVIYYWAANVQTILLLVIYSKNEQDNMSADEMKTLRKIIEAEFK